MNYRKLNVLLGWLVFIIATIVYFMTIEDTVSLWDCGEYIMAAYKLEVGHPPGAPLFMLLGRLFSFFAVETDVALWINRMSALSSSFTILFMFWSITLLVKKMILQTKDSLSKGDIIAVMGSGVVGALSYTFSDTFWFSAVEGEVYAMASLFTAVVFWAILKWDEEMMYVQNGKLSVDVAPNRWLILILFLIGLAIGVHLLGILLVPAICYVIYFRIWKEINIKSFLITGILSLIILAGIQEGVIPGIISTASKFEVTFRNSIGLPFTAGTIIFFAILIGGLIYLARFARKTNKTVLYNSVFGLIFLLIGYGSFAVIVIRSNADTPMDQNNPENLVNLHSYLTREQYGSTPLLTGPYWNSKETGGQFDGSGRWNANADRSQWKDRQPVYAQRFVVEKGGIEVQTFLKEKDANAYVKENGGTIEEKFYMVNGNSRIKAVPTYDQTTFLPRMFSADEPRKVEGYKMWSGYDGSRTDGEMGSDNLPLPSFAENIRYFYSYQINYMYFRYFMWNFAGRQNDIQGDGNQINGNWKSGFAHVDDARLGDQENAPFYVTNNKANNSFFFIPLILGLIGMFFHAYKSPKDAFVVFLGFLLTGLAIVVYLNQKVYEPRERDYAYAGSFYFFAIWIGFGVYSLYYAFTTFKMAHFKKFGIIALAGLVLFMIMDMSSENGMPHTMSWLTIAIIAAILLGAMNALGKVLKGEMPGAVLATVLGLASPIIMGAQGWDDHDRSNKTTAHDVAYNYMSSVSPNGIIFTNGDNDTFPLWYIQEVENFRSDVRVCNLSLMQTDWYTAQMMRKTYDSDPLPIKFTQDQILMYTGGTDYIQFVDLTSLYLGSFAQDETLKQIIDLRVKANKPEAIKAVNQFAAEMAAIIGAFQIEQPAVQQRIGLLKEIVTRPAQENNLSADIHQRFSAMKEIFGGFRSRSISGSDQIITSVQKSLETLDKGWESMNIEDVMAFVRNDKNMMTGQGSASRIFPTNTFKVKVNKDNLLKSGVIAANTPKDQIMDNITLTIEASAISREEVMMLDVIANNDWKRGLYFSSPYGSKVSRALLQAGALKQTGSTYAANPVKSDAPIDPEVMFASLMTQQHFGKMNDPKVLTDYYARRHVIQYRSQFASLAKYYLHRIEQATRVKTYPASYIQSIEAKADKTFDEQQIVELYKNGDKIIAEGKKRVSQILNRSQEVMPIEFILDGGEPNVSAQFKYQGATYPRYTDGVVVDFVQMYYDVDDKKQGDKIGLILEKQYRQNVEFFLNAPAHVSLSSLNQSHFLAAVDAYMQLYAASGESNPSGELAKKTQQYINELLGNKMNESYRRFESEIMDKSENIRRTRAIDLLSLKDYMEALRSEFGMIEGGAVRNNPSEVDFNELIQQQMKQDSVLQ